MLKYGDQAITSVKIGEDAISLVRFGDKAIFGGFLISFRWQCAGGSEDYMHGGFKIHHIDGTVENYYFITHGGETGTKSYDDVLYIDILYFDTNNQKTFNIITDDAPCVADTADGTISGNFADLMLNKLSGYSESNPVSVWLLGDCEVNIETES